MSLTSSLYAGTSGLGNTGRALQVTSNNISNINTIGFKKGTATFADTLYQTIGTNAGSSQVGLGMNVDNVAQVFTDGSLETTSNATDLAIGGDGFFIVSDPDSDESFYTRAGNFSFNEDGAMVSSSGYYLQGWYVEGDTGDEFGAVTDLILTEFTSPPDNTDEMTVITNLDSDAESFSTVLSNLFEYDEEGGSPMDSDGYEYQTVVSVYDSLGSTHEITVFYDKQSDTEWEYVITCDADEDKRALVEDSESAGLLARGIISFSESSGEIVSMSMEELTGVIGNVDVSGSNTVHDVHFEIEDYETIQNDGYGISMTFDGEAWNLDQTSLPSAYSSAEILSSNSSGIYLVLDPESSGGDTEADLKISLDEYATAGDTLSFDINDPTNLHVQDIENAVYSGEAFSNTTVSINDAGVMTTDAQDLSIIWNPFTETWSWSNPSGADTANTLISDANLTTTAGTFSVDASFVDITNADPMEMVVEDLDMYWTGTAWDWNEGLKENDITVTDATTVESDTSPEVSVSTSGSDGAATLAGDYTLTWDETTSTWSATTTSGTTIGTVTTLDEGLTMVVYSSTTSGASTIAVSLDDAMTTAGGQSITITIDSTPPEEYVNAQIMSTTGNDNIIIDFDGDSTADVTINVTGGTGTALTAGNAFSFNVDPDTPPAEYSSATLSGDASSCSIDLDGSGNEEDKHDIVFTFTEKLSSGSLTDPLDDRSVISFDIEGSTAWRTITDDEVEDSGYYEFSVDFLGGELGSTETNISFNIGSKFDGNNWINSSLSSTQYATSSSTTYQDADGYAAGDLTGVEVDSSGLVTGTYSNGQGLALFKIALADFNNVNGLKSVGGNLYEATTESGSAITNKAGQNGLGTLSSYALEMSNVDISDEFVSMIELQTAYEANAKIITTVDEMMSTVIGMKR